MRLWSLDPGYLDARGLTALWREALLARAVLRGRTKGYRRHPQLARFKNARRPISSVNFYLRVVFAESLKRGYNFDASKLAKHQPCETISVTEGQLIYEFLHLRKKLLKRAPEQLAILSGIRRPRPHPLFKPRAGEVEEWEKNKRGFNDKKYGRGNTI
jgi:hypothetical protein